MIGLEIVIKNQISTAMFRGFKCGCSHADDEIWGRFAYISKSKSVPKKRIDIVNFSTNGNNDDFRILVFRGNTTKVIICYDVWRASQINNFTNFEWRDVLAFQILTNVRIETDNRCLYGDFLSSFDPRL